MTILSDRQIKNLCLTAMYKPTHLQLGNHHPVVMLPKGHVIPAQSVKEYEEEQRANWAHGVFRQPRGPRVVEKDNQWCLSLIDGSYLVASVVALTDMISEFPFELPAPMLTPFVDHQVKTRQRVIHPTDATWEADRVIAKAQRGIEPDLDGDTLAERIISYGLSSYGYDVRLGNKFKIFTNVNSVVIDPLNMPDQAYVDYEGDVCVIPPNSYVLGHTIEYFDMPKDVVAICLGKSTYARAGCAINVTPIEPEFKGQVVIEIANQTPLPMKVYANMGIAQFLFLQGEPCEVSYAMRGGKYQGQMGVTTARV